MDKKMCGVSTGKNSRVIFTTFFLGGVMGGES